MNVDVGSQNSLRFFFKCVNNDQMKYTLIQSTDNLSFEAKLIDINLALVEENKPFEPALMFNNKTCIRLEDVIRSSNVLIDFESQRMIFGHLNPKKLVSLIGKDLKFQQLEAQTLITF